MRKDNSVNEEKTNGYEKKDNTRTRGKSNNTRTNGTKRKYSRTNNQYDAKGQNDPAWYATDAALLRDSASIPFSWATGTPIDFNNATLNNLPSKGRFTVPGICTIETAPSAGYADGPTSPVNVAANSIYSFIRSANSGSKNYDAPDLMIYLLAMSQAYAYINWMQRVYGVATLYSMRNRYLPQALLEADNVDFHDIQANLANFRYAINLFINKIASLAVPNNITFFNQQAFMYSNIYVEGESVKDQLYMYVPHGFWRFKLNPDGSGALEMIRVYSHAAKWKVSDFISYGQLMIDTIIADEDFNIMGGDILKAYGQNIIKLATLPEYYPITPVYNHTVLEQMKNSSPIWCDNFNLEHFESSLGVFQETNAHAYLVHRPSVRVTTSDTNYKNTASRFTLATLGENRVLTTSEINPGPEVVIESTRLMTVGTDYTKGSTTEDALIYLKCGNVIPVVSKLWMYVPKSDGSIELQKFDVYYADQVILDEMSVDDNARKFAQLAIEQCFKFHPVHHTIVYKHGTSAPAVSASTAYLDTDIDNYAVLTAQDVEKLHETALLNMLHVKPISRM